MRKLHFASFLILLASSQSYAQVTAEIREEKIIVFASEAVEMSGIDLQSAAGNLVPVPDPPGSNPFTFFVSNTPNQITWGNLGSTVTLEGVFNTNAGYVGDPSGDLIAAWGDGPQPVNIPVSVSGEVIPPGVVTPPTQPDPPIIPGPNTVPNPEGLVTGEIREGKILLFTNEPVPLAGVDFQSPAGNLVPVDDRLGSDPFQFMLSNTSNQVVFGNLGFTVNLDGALNTNVGYNGDPAGDLSSFWGNGANPVPFSVTLSNEAIPSGLNTPVLTPLPDPPTRPDPPITPDPPTRPTVPTLANPDGVVTGEVREGNVILFASEPAPMSGIDLQSAAGRLVPIENNDSAPFTFFLSNDSNRITWGNLASAVTIEGTFNTNAGYNGDPAGDLLAAWGNGPDPVSIPVVLSDEPIPGDGGGTTNPPTNPDPPDTPDPPANPDPPSNPPTDRPISGFLNDEGFLVISVDEPVVLSGLDIQSEDGNLVPIPDPPGPAPFSFFLSNTPNQITWGNLGTTVTLTEDWVTSAKYNGDPTADLVAFWGNGAAPIAFTFAAGATDEVVPEPSGAAITSLGLLAILCLRRNRRNRK